MPRPMSYSSLSTVQSCERKYAYRYVHRLKAEDRESSWMTLGIWWHATRAIDSIRRGQKYRTLVHRADEIGTGDGGPSFVPSLDNATVKVYGLDPTSPLHNAVLPLTVESVLIVAQDWWARKPLDYCEGFVSDVGEEMPRHLDNLWLRHLDRYGEEHEAERPLVVEAWWERPASAGSEQMLVGRIDEIYLDSRNLAVVRDWKLHGSWPQGSDVAIDLMDAQIHLYAWGASTLLAETEHSVKAVEYDRIRAKPPATPSWTKSGNLSKSTTDFDLWTYLRVIASGEATYAPYQKDVDDATLEQARHRYAEENGVEVDDVTNKQAMTLVTVTVTEADPSVVEELSTAEARDSFFHRNKRPVNLNVVRSHLRSAAGSLERADTVRARVEAGQEVPRNSGRQCDYCDYSRLCRAEMFGTVAPDTDPAEFGLKSLPVAD